MTQLSCPQCGSQPVHIVRSEPVEEWTNATLQRVVEGVGCALFVSGIGIPLAVLLGWLVGKLGWTVARATRYRLACGDCGHAWVWCDDEPLPPPGGAATPDTGALRCPTCGSPDGEPYGVAGYRCRHCGGVYHPPPPRLSARVDVILTDPGPTPLDVIHLLRAELPLDLRAAQALTQAPAVVARGLPLAEAQALAARLAAAGAVIRLRPV